MLFRSRHNKRELFEGGTIDPSRTSLNESIAGPNTADDVAGLARSLMADAGIEKPRRKDAVMGLEFVFSLPPNHQIDERAYFADCAPWVARQFGGVDNILSADIHRDEAAPHCHILLLPLLNGRLNGSKLFGNKHNLKRLQSSFHGDVASRYGLRKAPDRLQGTLKAAAVGLVLERLKSTADPVLQSAAWATFRDHIERDPAPFLLELGIKAPTEKQKPMKTMAQTFTSKGKGQKTEKSKPIGFRSAANPKPIGFDTTEKGQSLCSVGFRFPDPSLSTHSLPPEPLPAPPPTRLETGQLAIQTAMERQNRARGTVRLRVGPETITDGLITRVRDGEPLPDWD